MDIYLAATGGALPPLAKAADDRASVPTEDAYYARHSWSPSLPHWVRSLLAAIHRRRSGAAGRADVARYA